MKRYLVQILNKSNVKDVRWLYVSPSGTLFKDVFKESEATRFYRKTDAEDWCDKLEKRKIYKNAKYSVVAVNTDVVNPTRETYDYPWEYTYGKRR